MSVSNADMKVWLALEGRLDDLAALTGLTIDWPNTAFSAPAVGYLRVRHFPNAPNRPFLGSGEPHERLGVVQVMVFSKRGGAFIEGVDNNAAVLNIAGKVEAHFPPDLSMDYQGVRVKVLRAPRVGEVVNPAGSAYAECVVEIPYRCFA